MSSETVDGQSADGINRSVIDAATVLIRYLQITNRSDRHQAYRVLQALAEETERLCTAGRTPLLSAQNLKAHVAPKAAKEPSGWLSPLWSRLEQEQAEWQEGLSSVARELGLNHLPALRKRPGSPALYCLEAVPLRLAEGGVNLLPSLAPDEIRYTPAAVRAPGAWLSRALRQGVVRWSPVVRTGFLLFGVTSAVLAVSMIWIGLRASAQITRPFSLQDLVLVLVLGLVAWGTAVLFRFLDELFSMRIVIAPSLLVPVLEDHVTLEIRSQSNEDPVGELALIRYTATCLVCGGGIDIHKGGKEFPGRLVGRCRRSAREHVYSLDAVLRIGRPLRT